ncbi:farnesylcysteine lyase [Quillaja saponaria]|uniref:Farnesylcysteine lyase n=1 Tax=Quillaja saponaria TaxID=32244 RepID=A0AAD7KSZ5_QUISA|nr:farnesylcysteine lyase [Quillaja saponaria]
MNKLESGAAASTVITMAMMLSLFTFLLLSVSRGSPDASPASTVCIIGSGIGGSSVAHFLRKYSPNSTSSIKIRIFERNGIVGGRMATVNVGGETFEAGASILHPKNFHALNYTNLLKLKVKKPSSDSLSLGIWDGKKLIFKTVNSSSRIPFIQFFIDKVVSFANSVIMFARYGFSLLRMQSFVETTVNRFVRYYEKFEARPVFRTVDEMLKWAGLYNLTTRTLGEELIDAGLSPLLIQELVTVITRINYGQSVSMSALAGAVSLAGSGGGLWSVEGGNWQMAAGLINHSNVKLHLHEEIESVSNLGDYYELNSTTGNTYTCEVVVVATPLDELNIQFTPPLSIPERKLQHTHATFVRGLLNPAYFGLHAASKIPELVATIEDPDLPFTSISALKQHNKKDVTYKIFSRTPLDDKLLDSIFSARRETIRINWGAYPQYHAPEVFAPFILDGGHLYYVNAFENAASTIETSAVAAENIARLILSRFFSQVPLGLSKLNASGEKYFHVDL